MKRTLFLLLALVSLNIACNTNAQSKKRAENNKTINLDKATFLTKVFDFEKNNSWKYLGDKPAIIDFYATWCGPCRQLSPRLEEIAKEYDGKIYVYKIDVDKEPALAKAFGITSIPTILFVPMNEIPQISQGALSKEDLKNTVDNFMLKK